MKQFFIAFSYCVLFLISISTISPGLAQDYCLLNEKCASSSGGIHQRHVACNNDGRIRCPDGQLIQITAVRKAAILNEHNKYRNLIASGGNPKFPSATRMATLTWDDELAYLAELNVKSCEFKHDCPRTERFPYAGQNIAMVGDQGGIQIDKFITDEIGSWYNENVNAPEWIIRNYVHGRRYGHFAELVKYNNFKVGCAVLTNSDPVFQHNATITCNYSSGIMGGHYIYESGPKASHCQTGQNPQYPALCSVKEIYNASSIP